MGASLTRLLTTRGRSYTQWRQPALSGGKIGAATQIATLTPVLVVPTSDAGDWLAAAEGLSGGRSTHVAMLLNAPDLKPSDELRDSDDARYKVISAPARWRTLTAVALSRVE